MNDVMKCVIGKRMQDYCTWYISFAANFPDLDRGSNFSFALTHVDGIFPCKSFDLCEVKQFRNYLNAILAEFEGNPE